MKKVKRPQNYWIKIRYNDWMGQVRSFTPRQRDLLMIIIFRRCQLHNEGREVTEREINYLHKEFYRGLKKITFMKDLEVLCQEKAVIRNQDLVAKDKGHPSLSYTTRYNEKEEIYLEELAENSKRAEAKKEAEGNGKGKDEEARGKKAQLISNNISGIASKR